MDGNFIEPAAFRLAKKDGRFEDGLSVNWNEYFQTSTPEDSIASLCDMLVAKGRKVGGESKFARLNVRSAKYAAAMYTAISIVHAPVENDPSHAIVTGYEAYNDQVAEELAKMVIAIFPAKP